MAAPLLAALPLFFWKIFMSIVVKCVDFSSQEQGRDLLHLLNSYALDPMGGAQPLSEYVLEHLLDSLAARSDALSLIAYVDDVPAGVANCFEGFSTFSCKPILNIHDIAVLPQFRRQGIGNALLAEVETQARKKGCCKITLEVLEGNKTARKAYQAFGFGAYALDPEVGAAMFWQKEL